MQYSIYKATQEGSVVYTNAYVYSSKNNIDTETFVNVYSNSDNLLL